MNHRFLITALVVTALGVGTASAQGLRSVTYGPAYGHHPGYQSTMVCTTYPSHDYQPRPVYRHYPQYPRYPDHGSRVRVSINYGSSDRWGSEHRRYRRDDHRPATVLSPGNPRLR